MTRVYLEIGAKRTFAMALDWPGWGRSGRTAEEALEALADYATRYAPVAKKAGLSVDATFDVWSRCPATPPPTSARRRPSPPRIPSPFRPPPRSAPPRWWKRAGTR